MKIGDTVKVKELHKYGSVAGAIGQHITVKLFDGGEEYSLLVHEIEKITFVVVDHALQTVSIGLSLEEAHARVKALDETMSGYWYVYGSDDEDEPWMGAGLTEFDPYKDDESEEE